MALLSRTDYYPGLDKEPLLLPGSVSTIKEPCRECREIYWSDVPDEDAGFYTIDISWLY